MCWPKSLTLTAGELSFGHQPLQSVELALGVHRFAEAVGEDRDEVAWLEHR